MVCGRHNAAGPDQDASTRLHRSGEARGRPSQPPTRRESDRRRLRYAQAAAGPGGGRRHRGAATARPQKCMGASMKIRELMSKDVVTIEDTATCHDAVVRMMRHRVRHLPVVTRHGTLCGIVTDRDLRHYLFEPETFRQIGAVKVDTILNAIPVSRV